ncbi:MAG: hypothetical protein K8U03_11695 [Planctomycetia bacterium]|nr:hypothetical protein [Planctomycetia bacterium]
MLCPTAFSFERLLSAIAFSIALVGLQEAAIAGYPSSYYGTIDYGTVDPNSSFYLDINDQLFPGGGSAPLALPERTRELPTAESLLAPRTQPYSQPYAASYPAPGGYHPTSTTYGGYGSHPVGYRPIYEGTLVPRYGYYGYDYVPAPLYYSAQPATYGAPTYYVPAQ